MPKLGGGAMPEGAGATAAGSREHFVALGREGQPAVTWPAVRSCAELGCPGAQDSRVSYSGLCGGRTGVHSGTHMCVYVCLCVCPHREAVCPKDHFQYWKCAEVSFFFAFQKRKKTLIFEPCYWGI